MNFISRYCRIKSHTITGSGETLRFANDSLESFQMQVYDHLKMDYPKFFKMDSQSRMGLIAATYLLNTPYLAEYPREEIALVLANAESSLDTDKRYHDSIATAASPALFVYTLPNIVAGEICIRFGLKGENAFFILPEFDVRQMCEYADMILDNNIARVCIGGWINVLKNEHDVLLYLIEKQHRDMSLEHTPANLEKLYRT